MLRHKVSIIVTHWGQNEERSELMRTCLNSLAETAIDAEVIVVDNGGVNATLEDADSEWLSTLCGVGYIACYIRNRKNMSFGYARNQALKLCSGDYIVIADNDIAFEKGWLEACLAFHEKHPGKYLTTPLAADPMSAKRQIRWVGEVDGWKLNSRAGSNCFMMSRAQFEDIGYFGITSLAGSRYVDVYNRKGYVMAVAPTPLARDLGLRRGFNRHELVDASAL